MLEQAGKVARSAIARTRAHYAAPPWEVRTLRIFIGVALIGAAVSTLDTVLSTEKPILEENKLEVGMMIGWIIAKTGTVIDWLFGGSESGTRRADAQAHGPTGEKGDPLAVEEEGRA